MENEKQRQQEDVDVEFKEMISTLPSEKDWGGVHNLYLYKDSWYRVTVLEALIHFQKNFRGRDNDIILATAPKSGTTWLKSIVYLITNRSHFELSESPLLTSNSHDLVPFFEFDLFFENQCPNLENIPDPRIFATHIPYTCLPASITELSKCKIVYVCRNPLDQFVSMWHFLFKLYGGVIPVEEAFELYCKGISRFGPFWDHVLGYWKASQENPGKVLFLKYEDLKQDNIACTRKIAEFLGFPFSDKEEEQGVVEEICRICSFENNGRGPSGVTNHAYFRKGEVGDWSNHLTPAMAERLYKILEEKLKDSGLSFGICRVKSREVSGEFA